MTLQRGTSYIARTDTALREGLVLEEQLNRRYTEMEQVKKVFEAHWNEQMRHVREKQDVFQSQVSGLNTTIHVRLNLEYTETLK